MNLLYLNLLLLLLLLTTSSLVYGSKTDPKSSSTTQKNDNLIHAQSRDADSTKKSTTTNNNKAVADMHSIYQQHLIGPNVASAIAPHDETNNNKRDAWFRFGNKEGSSISSTDNKKGRLQTVGSVIGDIIGVIVSEIARFFGSVVSDVAREVTAHGFVSLFKQIADITGISRNSHGHGNGPSSLQSSSSSTSGTTLNHH